MIHFSYIDGIYNSEDEKIGEEEFEIHLEFKENEAKGCKTILMVAPVEADLGALGWRAYNQMVEKVPSVLDFIGDNQAHNHQEYTLNGERRILWLIETESESE